MKKMEKWLLMMLKNFLKMMWKKAFLSSLLYCYLMYLSAVPPPDARRP